MLPAVLIVLWVAGAGLGGPYFGKVEEVSSNDQTTFLPESSDATQVQERLSEFTGSDAIPAVVVFVGDSELSDSQLESIQDAVDGATSVTGVADDVSPAIPSDDGLAAQAFVPIDESADVGEVIPELGDELRAEVGDGITVYVTGPAGFTADLSAGFAGIDGLLLAVALIAVFVILVIVYRSLLLPIIVLSTSMFALCVALLTVWWLAYYDVILLSGQTQGILFILVIGAATDYSLLYVARFREALRAERSTWAATWTAIRGSIEPILASGSTVIAGLLCLLLSDLKSNSTLGPVAAIGIVFAMLSALTFLPAMLYACGRAAFWPKRPHYDPSAVEAEHGMPRKGIWAHAARTVAKRPRAIWIATTIVLAIGAAFVPQLKADGVPQSDLVLGESEARNGQNALGEHFPGGSGSPVYVIVPEDEMPDAARILSDNEDIDGVSVTAADSPAGTVPLNADGEIELPQGAGPPPGVADGAAAPEGSGAPEGAGAPGGAGASAVDPADFEPTVLEGQVLLQATLTQAADSAAASDTVRELRDELHELPGEVLVGGVTATSIDTNDAAIHDRNLIIPIVLVVIMFILMLLLRSILAPVLLIITTVLSFGTAMGVSALVFNGIFDFPGADPAVPLYGFVFLVALGIDYNIFLMTRVREESLVHGTHAGVLRGLAVTGGVITSAGVVLAATFAALAVIPILFLVQLAFIVAFGVLLDTFVVRTLLVPALTYDIGKKVWWPSKLGRFDGPKGAAEAAIRGESDGTDGGSPGSGGYGSGGTGSGSGGSGSGGSSASDRDSSGSGSYRQGKKTYLLTSGD
ncbi:MMPL family transporter [Brevibacterium sp. R8603A2]|uniref:MMPL family transporter n=1 Tax=Brevibacterium sp. R8603A2 TaxID=2929779 RepID=UPI001FF839DA|nr:MMPL family transporter [Brevibacterium sp. R8603A2]MCK1803427.1 MMPL family transporter [Brevibacterium sp. R8603A2]